MHFSTIILVHMSRGVPFREQCHGRNHTSNERFPPHPARVAVGKQVLKLKVETLQADLSRRQESYIRRERAFNMRIEELEEEVGSLKVGALQYLYRD